ncbi:polysaccharide biosynthesis C-terminal domain-containing protein [Myxococcota bacterium]|nr:polysaccharide biosynthesis C-terminal domain-containing protein [Myxococcota bacterium]MBU1382175.1 polysaccharide biosynthesis C-terminal domain-containing protein [Myxococcota bacterium]MBU1498735.1 polysaccharide biosynthesis C-terminal domain-containing protein [Myxococcota bacterium]
MTEADITRKIKKGAFVNFIGMLTKIIGGPVLFLVLTRMYGKVSIGIFFIAYNLVEILGGLAISGFIDATVMFASRHIHDENNSDVFNSYMRKIILSTLLLSTVLALLLVFGAPVLNKFYYKDYPELVPMLQIMAFILPLEAVSRLAVAIPKAHLKMGVEVITIGGVFPIATLVLAVLFRLCDLGTVGTGLSFLLGWVITGVVSIFMLNRLVDIRKFMSFKFVYKPTPDLFTFAIAQNLNMALNRLISSMDVLMLAGFGVKPGMIAFYSIGAQIVRNVRQVKLIFSGIYSPVIARHYHEGRISELNNIFEKITGWAISLGIPALFVVAFYRQDLVMLFDSSFNQNPDFMIILLINPFLSIATGLTGNAIIMAGFSRWNLFNSITVGVLNFIFNLILIPHWGLMGAAVATAISGTIVSIMQIIEARKLIGMVLSLKILSFWIILGLLIFLWPFFPLFTRSTLVARLITGGGLMAIYAIFYFSLNKDLKFKKGTTNVST